MTSVRPILLSVSLAFVPILVAAHVPVGSEFRVDISGAAAGSTGGTHKSVTMAPSGRFVVAWPYPESPFGPYDAMARVFAASGRARGPEFRVNAETSGAQVNQAVASDDEGNFVVVWSSLAGGNDIVFGQRFDAQGQRRGVQFQVTPPPTVTFRRPSVAMAPSGAFVVVWESLGVFARRYDASGAPSGGEFQVTASTTYISHEPSVAISASGDFIVAWGRQVPDPIVGRRFAPDGTPLGPPFAVAQAQMAAGQPRVAIAGDGSFVVAWSGGVPGDGHGSGVAARRFTATGAPIGAEFLVNVYTTSSQLDPDLAVDADGDFVITWRSDSQGGPGTGVFARRFDAAGAAGPEFEVPTYTTGAQGYPSVANDAAGNFIVTWLSQANGGLGRFARRFAAGLMPAALAVDAVAGPASDGNGVLESNETVVVAPSWLNADDGAQAFAGSATRFTGPGTSGNPTYAVVDAVADYGTVATGATASCGTTGDCYAVRVTQHSARPALHWDAVLREDIAPASLGGRSDWTLHMGDSFADVPRSSPFYRFIETLLHHQVTGGCTGGDEYCPANPTSRAQMAVMVLASKEGEYQPPACAHTWPSRFADVPSTHPFCAWIEELARRGVVGGCGGGNYCPSAPVSRQEMAVFVLATKEPGIQPPACGSPSTFLDVPASSPFCRWIEELARRGVVGGCGGGSYCPGAPVTREQMAVFLAGTFGLTLYGP